jgi:hypothetical protein
MFRSAKGGLVVKVFVSTSPVKAPSRWRLRLAVLAAFCAGWWVRGRFVAPEPAPPRVIAAEPSADTDLDILRRQVAEQREMLRGTALQAAPSADEMLALIPSRFNRGDWSPPELGQVDDCWFETIDGMRLHGWHLRQPNARGAVLLLHGNGGNVPMWVGLAEEFRTRMNVSVLVFDYRGYGRSEGVPTLQWPYS